MADIRDAWGKDGENPLHVLFPVHVIYKVYISQINLLFLYRLTMKLPTFLDDDSAPFIFFYYYYSRLSRKELKFRPMKNKKHKEVSKDRCSKRLFHAVSGYGEENGGEGVWICDISWLGGGGGWMGRVCKNSFVLLSFGVALFLLAKYAHQQLNTFF
jgi:hypothetical protein